jgi:4-hydroxy-tetrahydrodipicolinate synthase
MSGNIHSSELSGVFPVLPTPFDAAGRPDVAGLQKLVRYLLASGVDGMTYPGVASEASQLDGDERQRLLGRVLQVVDGRVPVIAGVSSPRVATTIALARAALEAGAAVLMIAAPPELAATAQQIDHFGRIAAALPGATLMLQNLPLPAGPGLEPSQLLEILRAVPAIRYVKEEALPSGQRLTQLLQQDPPAWLAGVFGGAGGRYITDELRRGACGTMPAVELAEVHVALMAAHRAGDADRARQLFTRMLPILNLQAVFRWSLTKSVLQRRGLIACSGQRAAGPRVDSLDMADIDAFLGDLADLLLSPAALAAATAP